MKREPKRTKRPAYADVADAMVDRRSFMEAAGKLALGAAVLTSAGSAVADVLGDPPRKRGVMRPPRPVEATPETIHRIMRKKRVVLAKCYEDIHKKDPSCAGKLVLRLEVDLEGKGVVTPAANHTGSPLLSSCIIDKMAKWHWPKAIGKKKAFLLPIVFMGNKVEVKPPELVEEPKHIPLPGEPPIPEPPEQLPEKK